MALRLPPGPSRLRPLPSACHALPPTSLGLRLAGFLRTEGLGRLRLASGPCPPVPGCRTGESGGKAAGMFPRPPG